MALREVPGAKTANFASWHLNVPDSEPRIFPERGPQFYAELLIKKFVSACGAAQELSIFHPSQPTKKAKDIGKPLIIYDMKMYRPKKCGLPLQSMHPQNDEWATSSAFSGEDVGFGWSACQVVRANVPIYNLSRDNVALQVALIMLRVSPLCSELRRQCFTTDDPHIPHATSCLL